MKRTMSLFGLAFVLTITACTVDTGGGPGQPEPARKPNFLLVVADDMSFTDLGSFGGEIETPTIDALAQRGVRFSNFRVSVSCSPTRSMLLSGTDNHQAGLGTMGELIQPFQKGKPGYEGHLNERVVSLAEVLHDGGYHTYLAGKWHLGHEDDSYPAARGFERSFSMLYGGASHWRDMSGLIARETPVHYTRNGEKIEELPADFYSSRSYADFLMDSIRENRGDGKPFLAYLAFTAPHDPMHVPEPWRSKYRGRYDAGYEALKQERVAGAKSKGVVSEAAAAPGRHPMVRPWASLSDGEKAWERAQMEVYAGMVDNMDYHLGRVIDFLKDIDEYDNTVIVFFSDNGPNPWSSKDYPTNKETGYLDRFDNRVENIGNMTSHSAYGIGWATAGSGPLSYFKMAVAEGGIRSPLIIAGPGVDRPGRITQSFSYVTDIMPTMLDLAGIEHPSEYRGRAVLPLRGRSMAGVLSGKDENVHEPGTLIAGEMFGGRWISDGTHKAVLVAKPYGPGVWELYNLADDPGETHNLAEEKPEILQQFIEAWDQYAKDVGVAFPPV